MGKASSEKRARREAREAEWTPFEKAPFIKQRGKPDREVLRKLGKTEEEIDHTIAMVEEAAKHQIVFINNKYQVIVRRVNEGMVHLSIKRLDRKTIHDWRDLQRIKNELVGTENEAVEIYPAESRLVDTSNQYHLWVYTDPSYRLPFGYTERLVTEEKLISNTTQRKL